MKTRKIIFLITSALLICFITSVAVFTNADYSVSNDPLVTLSYVNETLVPEIEKRVTESVIEALKKEYGEPAKPDDQENQSDSQEQPKNPVETIPSADLDSLKYTVVHLTKGQKLFANGPATESTEIILRAGEAISISPFEDQGIADLTASAQLYNGDALVKNNYCIIPRGQDGRGIEILSEEAYLLVRGVYKVE